jgi:hypothetical protein
VPVFVTVESDTAGVSKDVSVTRDMLDAKDVAVVSSAGNPSVVEASEAEVAIDKDSEKVEVDVRSSDETEI